MCPAHNSSALSMESPSVEALLAGIRHFENQALLRAQQANDAAPEPPAPEPEPEPEPEPAAPAPKPRPYKSGACAHLRNKSQCATCSPQNCCEHYTLKIRCRICTPPVKCPHWKKKSNCKICSPTLLCPHNNHRHQCKRCKKLRTAQREATHALIQLAGQPGPA